ncbi:MAG: hypothetical protein JWM80_5791 [Cyanobacteria bacterium RYN_339]|nr:hypothetical protein [Cyanobacteria bacterium RYN_339]
MILSLLAAAALALPTPLDDARYSALSYKLGTAAFVLPAGTHLVAQSKGPGFQGIALEELPSRRVVVAFTGTQTDDVDDVLADLGVGKSIALGLESSLVKKLASIAGDSGKTTALNRTTLRDNKALRAQVAAATAFEKEVIATGKHQDGKPVLATEVRLTGHSLGGFLAQVVAVRASLPATTFNAPGATAYLDPGATAHIVNHMRAHDIVGRVGNHVGNLVLYSDVKVQWTNLKERYVIRNHSIDGLVTDLTKQPTGKAGTD